MPSAIFFDQFHTDLANGVHKNWLTADTDVLKLALSNTAPDHANNAVFGDIVEIGAGNGYTAGGNDVGNAHSITSGIIEVTGIDQTWTASGGPIGPFQWFILYNSTPASPNKPLICSWNRGSSKTLNDGESITADFLTNLYRLAK